MKATVCDLEAELRYAPQFGIAKDAVSGRHITFAVGRADRSFRGWLVAYGLAALIDPAHFYPTNRYAAAAYRAESG